MIVPIRARYAIGGKGEAPTLIGSTMADVPEAALLGLASETILGRCSGETRTDAAPYIKAMTRDGKIATTKRND